MHSKLTIGLLAVALFASCSDDDDDGGGGGPLPAQAVADVVIGDAAVDDLLAFSAVVESVRVRRMDGTFTVDLMTTGSLEVEFLGLNDVFTPLARGILDEGTYTAVEIGFTPGSYEAVDEAGNPVTVNAAGDTLLAPLANDFVVDVDQYVRMEVDLDLLDSLEGDVSSGTITFDPDGTTELDDGGTPLEIEEFKGLVIDFNQAGAEFTVQAFIDDEQLVSIGTVLVRIGVDTLFLDEDGIQLDAPDYFDALAQNLTLVEIYGNLDEDGVVTADRVEIEDQAGGGGSMDLVRLEGLVVDTFLNGFTLRVSDIEDGTSIAEPILVGLGTNDVEVAYGVDTVFVVGRDSLSDASALELGRKVSVEFCTFTTAPFPACIVDVGNQVADFEGVVTAVAGLPDSLTMQMDAGEVAITSGLVMDEDTDVNVDLTGSTIVLGLDGQPALVTDDVDVGLEAAVEGAFSGTPDMPTLTATRVVLQPGRLRDAMVTLADEPNSRFLTTGGDIVDPFGPNVTPGAQQVLIQPGATFSGDVASAAELFDLLESPQGAKALVDVRGLGSPVANEIRAYHVDARVGDGL